MSRIRLNFFLFAFLSLVIVIFFASTDLLAQDLIGAVKAEEAAEGQYIIRTRQLGPSASPDAKRKVYEQTLGPARRARAQAESDQKMNMAKMFKVKRDEMMKEVKSDRAAGKKAEPEGGFSRANLAKKPQTSNGISKDPPPSKSTQKSPTYKTPSSSGSSGRGKSEDPKFEGKDLPKMIDFSKKKPEPTPGAEKSD
jgi:hypothetical protein